VLWRFGDSRETERPKGRFSCDQIVHVMALSDTYTFASPVVMEVRAEVDWFAQIVIRRKK
jgi:hypothetical protein